MRRVDHSKQNHEGGLLNIVSVLNAVYGRNPVDIDSLSDWVP